MPCLFKSSFVTFSNVLKFSSKGFGLFNLFSLLLQMRPVLELYVLTGTYLYKAMNFYVLSFQLSYCMLLFLLFSRNSKSIFIYSQVAHRISEQSHFGSSLFAQLWLPWPFYFILALFLSGTAAFWCWKMLLRLLFLRNNEPD